MRNQTNNKQPAGTDRRGFLRKIFTLGLGSAAAYAVTQPTANAQSPTTMMVGEEGRPNWNHPPKNFQPTTMAVGEEGQPSSRPQPRPQITTRALGEEGQPPIQNRPTTMAVGEEGRPPSLTCPPAATTLAVGEGSMPTTRNRSYPWQTNPATRIIGRSHGSSTPTQTWNSFRRW